MSAPISYRGWSVSPASWPEPAWTAVNGEKASAATFNQLCTEIDVWFEENGPLTLREIIAAEINVGDRYAIADRILAAMGASDKSDRAGHEQSPQAVSAVPVTIPSALLELAERCENAEGPDRQIDEAIRLLIERNIVVGLDLAGGWVPLGTPHFTASIDDAMTLVPEGWFLELEQHAKSWTATLGSHLWFDDRRVTQDGSAATPALTLCAAALCALASGTSAGTAETAQQAQGDSPQARPDAQTPASTKDTDR